MERIFSIHLKYAIGAIVLTLLVLFVSLLPSQELPSTSLFQADKLIHFSMYFLLTILFYKGFFEIKNKNIYTYLATISIPFSIGFGIEILQHFVTETRSFDKFDILANGIGCFFAFLAIKYIFNR